MEHCLTFAHEMATWDTDLEEEKEGPEGYWEVGSGIRRKYAERMAESLIEKTREVDLLRAWIGRLSDEKNGGPTGGLDDQREADILPEKTREEFAESEEALNEGSAADDEVGNNKQGSSSVRSKRCPDEVTVLRGGLDPPRGQSGFGSYFFVELGSMIEDELNRNNTDFVIVPETDHKSAYFTEAGSVRDNKWNAFFSPVNEHLLGCIADSDDATDIHERNKDMSRVREYNYDLSIHSERGRLKAWPYGDEGEWYGPIDQLNETWFRDNRQRGHVIASKYHVPQPAIASHIAELQRMLFRDRSPMLGVHMRGTDKLAAGGRRIIYPEEYLPVVRSFRAKFPEGGIFVATDDAQMLQELGGEQDMDFISQSISRAEGNSPPFLVDHTDGPHALGVEIMTDIYLLSRCDYLLHGVSSVTEAVMYINYDLHANSINLEYPHDGDGYFIPWET